MGSVYRGSICHPARVAGQVKFTGRRRRACWPGMEKKVITADSPKGADVASGIVKFLVDVVDETGETVAVATILTMVRKLDQS
ncbi:MAG: hypothetical protein IPI81_03675 [Flavobacteriales bacterium]|nr:hypothetical protein [Flavobacteriales bacterium]MCC6937665.1 hypothetical protein [Flavobacteriales bacterium]